MIVLATVLPTVRSACAQNEPPRATKGQDQIKEVGPEIFYVRDKDGNLLPLPGRWTYEDFMKLYNLQQQGLPVVAKPVYNIERLVAVAKVRQSRVQIDLQLDLTLLKSGWTRVPLQMPNAVMVKPPAANAKRFLHHAGEEAGYVVWINDEVDSKHKLEFSVSLPVESLGEERSMRWTVPRATTSKLTLTIPQAKTVVTASPGVNLLPPKAVGNDTIAEVLGISGLVELSWRPLANTARAQMKTLEATGVATVKLNRDVLRTEMELTVSNSGRPFSQFHIVLPPGVDSASDVVVQKYRASVDQSPKKTIDKRKVVGIKLEQPQKGPVNVRIVTERPYSLGANGKPPAGVNGAGANIDLAGFEVPEAAAQFGYVVVQDIGDWLVLWQQQHNVRRVEKLPATLPGDEVLARFEYFGQPFSLRAQVMLPRKRIVVQPEYLVSLSADEARLDGQLKYRVGGAKIYELQFDLSGWDENSLAIEPAALFDQDQAIFNEGKYRIPFKQAMGGEIEIQIRATKRLEGETGKVDFRLPQPLDPSISPASVSPALVAITPADNVLLTPSVTASANLTPTQETPTTELPNSQQQTLLYRADGAEARFVGAVEVVPQQVAVDGDHELRVQRDQISISQSWRYNIRHEPLQAVRLFVPMSLRSHPSWRLTIDGRAIDLSKELREANGSSDEVVVSVKPTLGHLLVQLTSRLPLRELNQNFPRAVTVPLARPSGVLANSSSQLRVLNEPGISIQMADDRWQPADTERQTIAPEAQYFEATEETEYVKLLAQRQQRVGTHGMLVRLAWYQTWLAGDGLHQRVAYRFTTELEKLAIGLPGELLPEKVQVLLDGVTIPSVRNANAELVVALPGGESAHTLELRYVLPNASADEANLPKLPDGSWIDQAYWQIVLPRNVHLLAVDSDSHTMNRWHWRRFGFGRQPELGQVELAELIGIDAGAMAPERANQYLFTRFSTGDQLQLHTVKRSTIVLFAAGAALAAGVLLLYVPRVRHPLTLLLFAIALLGAGFVAPDLALLTVQTAAIGLLLLLLALFVRRYAGRTQGASEVPGDSTGSSVRQSTTEYYHDQWPEPAYDTSVTTAMPSPPAASESKV